MERKFVYISEIVDIVTATFVAFEKKFIAH